MLAIAAHFRYISKSGRIPIEDDREEVREGREALHDLVEQWRLGGSLIDDVGYRREAFNIMLSMPRGVDSAIVQRAAREFARTELRDHLRATARTMLQECLGFNPDVIEAQVAQCVRDSLGRAYNRTEFLDQRRKMLQSWANYLDGLKKGG